MINGSDFLKWLDIFGCGHGGITPIYANFFNANVVSHSDTPLILTNPLANLQVITLTNASIVRLPQINGQIPAWKGRTVTVNNAGVKGVDSAFDIIANDGITVIYSGLECGQTVLLNIDNDSTANGVFVTTLIPNGKLISRQSATGVNIDRQDYFGAVIEATGAGSNFTASAIGSGFIVNGFNCWLKNNSTGNITFTPTAPNLIDGVSSITLAPNESVWLLCNGTEWESISLSRTAATIGLNLFNTNVVSHSTTPFILTNPLANIQVITLTSSNTVQFPAINGQSPAWKGRSILVRNAGNANTNAPFDIIANDGITVIYSGLECGQTVLITVIDDSTANGTYITNLLPNGQIIRRGSMSGGSIDRQDYFGVVVEALTAGSNFTSPLIGTGLMTSGFNTWLKNVSTGDVTFTPTSPNLIDGQSSITIASQESVRILCNGSFWESISFGRSIAAIKNAVFGVIQTVSANTNINGPFPTRILCNTNSGNITLTLADFTAAAAAIGQIIEISNTGTSGGNVVNITNYLGASLISPLPQGVRALIRIKSVTLNTIDAFVLGSLTTYNTTDTLPNNISGNAATATTVDQSTIFSSYVNSLSANLDLRNITNFPILPTYIDVTFDSNLRDIILPATNASNAAKAGKLIIIKNSSSSGSNRILAQDGATVLFTLTAGTNIVFELTSTGTINGTWTQILGISDLLGTMAYQNANAVAISGGSATTMTNLEVSTSNSGAINKVRSNNSSNTANSSAMFEAVVAGASAGDAYTKYTVAAVTDWASGVDNSDSDAYVIAASDTLGITNIMRAAKGGTVTFPKTPAFLGYNDTFRGNVTGDGTIYTLPFNQEIFDQSFSYDTSTGIFTAADTSRVFLGCTLLITNITNSGVTTHNAGVVRISTSNRPYEVWAASPQSLKDANGNIIVNVGQLVDMDVGDVAHMELSISGGTKTIAVSATLYDTTFFGFVAC